ncbi:hypothetical protein T06_8187 [Trichinella sp. T6]|nr:hypothetical protein T06_8187 [Trichinella sp. T6]
MQFKGFVMQLSLVYCNVLFMDSKIKIFIIKSAFNKKYIPYSGASVAVTSMINIKVSPFQC